MSAVQLLARARKAVWATSAAAAGGLGLAMLDGDLTRPETIAAAGLGLVTGFGTYQIRNARTPITPPAQDPAQRPSPPA